MKLFQNFQNLIREIKELELFSENIELWKNDSRNDKKEKIDVVYFNKMDKNIEEKDVDREYVFTKKLNLDTPSLLNLANTQNHIWILAIEKQIFSSISLLHTIQKWPVCLMELLICQTIDNKQAISALYFFFAMIAVHLLDFELIEDSMLLSAKYRLLIYTLILMNITIYVQQYFNQDISLLKLDILYL